MVGPTLNTLDGAEHRERRSLVQPALDRRRVAGRSAALAARADAAQARWRDGARIRLRGALDPLSLAMAGDVLLGVDLEPRAVELAHSLTTVMAGVPRLTPPLPGTTHGRALSDVRTRLRELLADRRHDPSEPDLPGLLLRAGLHEEIVMGELTAFLLAAVDEPPSGLAAAWYLLGRHPEAEARFHAELDEVVGEGAYEPGHEPRLRYLDAVIGEALRLLPPARYVDRCPAADTLVAGSSVRAGTNLLLSPVVTHHDARLFDDPERFAPERWLERLGTPRTAREGYFPFGAGPHTCIGEPLARLIMTTTLATIGKRWRILVDADAQPPVPGHADLVVTLERR